ncbi:hypothetical protein [Streptomyces cyaneochromogenes]|nr:hypothetical protein [Streptomyces cyaneochromogenes]
MATHAPAPRTGKLHESLASLLRARRTPPAPGDGPGTPDVWLAGLRLRG